ncbi:glycosyl hydrolase family 88 [Lacticaseibacillus salsurivasis]|uniref:glycosyl hydrolase family 88 n=1 Tax=Lacticaseibacillus salsurivasis TaxID=3081441 RepID=UPI0030C77C39
MTANQAWLEATYQKIIAKVAAERERIGAGIPYISKDGRYDDKSNDITWWTNGFWGGLLWQLNHATGDEAAAETARGLETKLDQAFLEFKGLHHDVGFMWLPTAVADYRLTGSERSLQRGLHAAELLAGRYNPRGKFIRSWNRDRAGWVIIDSMFNIQLLYWATDALKDPRFKFIADDHAHTVMENIVRPDGSVAHIAVFDPNTGELVETLGGQGYGVCSSWSRGQAWAISGFALAYAHTHEVEYLDTAKKVANYFIANVATTGDVPLVDFRAPAEPVLLDTSASACAACGMLEIAKHVPELEQPLYVNAATRMLKAIADHHADWDLATDGIVQDATPAYHDAQSELERPLIYGDYYFVEGILRLLGKDFLLW